MTALLSAQCLGVVTKECISLCGVEQVAGELVVNVLQKARVAPAFALGYLLEVRVVETLTR